MKPVKLSEGKLRLSIPIRKGAALVNKGALEFHSGQLANQRHCKSLERPPRDHYGYGSDSRARSWRYRRAAALTHFASGPTVAE